MNDVCQNTHCTNKRAISSYTGKTSVKCEEHLEKARLANRESYHKRGKEHRNKEVMNTKLVERNELIWKLKGDNADLRERIVVMNKKLKSLEQSYDSSQKSLATAVSAANAGGDGSELPSDLKCAVSIRNESTVIVLLRNIESIAEGLAGTLKAMKIEQKSQKESIFTDACTEVKELGDQLKKVISRQMPPPAALQRKHTSVSGKRASTSTRK